MHCGKRIMFRRCFIATMMICAIGNGLLLWFHDRNRNDNDVTDSVGEFDNIDPGKSDFSDNPLYLDYSTANTRLSADEKLELINSFEFEKIDKVFVAIFQGTAAGKSYTVTSEESPELLSRIVSVFFNGDTVYTSTARPGASEDYSFYITYYNESGLELMTLFYFIDKISFDGQFFETTSDIDTTPVSVGLRESIK